MVIILFVFDEEIYKVKNYVIIHCVAIHSLKLAGYCCDLLCCKTPLK